MNGLFQATRPFAFLLLCAVAMIFPSNDVFAIPSDNKKTALENVRRVVLTLPYFGTSDYLNGLTSKPSKPPKPLKSIPDPTDGTKPSPEFLKRTAEETHTFLAKLEAQIQDTLQARLKERTPFEWVSVNATPPPMKPLESGEKQSKVKPKDDPDTLFRSEGRIKGTKFPLPNPDGVRKVALENHADAVLLTVMDEPKRDGGGYFFDISGVGYISPHAAGKIAFYLYLANGTEVLHEYVEVLHPISKVGNRDYTQVDMTETYTQIIENFLDELTRYTPGKGAKP